MTPIDHTSTAFPYGFCASTSGAKIVQFALIKSTLLTKNNYLYLYAYRLTFTTEV